MYFIQTALYQATFICFVGNNYFPIMLPLLEVVKGVMYANLLIMNAYCINIWNRLLTRLYNEWDVSK